ncbi:uncharacterized protein LOC110465364 [Mizuhopecten yessoensis]|uniref:uncharacterized protein LOC110465364 n=1 Tax=Mizuhopecten yessoensis TaxID=6573 RepID=UPI000B4598E1|nr:uncharacterized protein LOC110465364 [Mizuhopecten yessoensis]XP_021376814.1 uncharacterized protein LOC110465364 [Mizuhopecten yessoensis]
MACSKSRTRLFGYVTLTGSLLTFVMYMYQGHTHILPANQRQTNTDIVSVKVKSMVRNVTASNDASPVFPVTKETCRVPNLDPYGPTVKKFIRVQKHHQCQHWNLITYQKDFKITVNRTVIEKHYQTFSKCLYQPYVKQIGTDRKVKFLQGKFLSFTEFIEVTDEFCLVICVDTNDTKLTQQHFAFVIRNETLIRLRQEVSNITDGMNLSAKRRMNVVMIGLESTSRLNFIRHMNFTKNFLQNAMAAVELIGYNKVGLNTFPNLVAMLLGITKEQMNDTRGFYDEYPLIWKDFMRAGYVTLLGQDASSTAVFQYLRKGFKRAPVDYYMRPFVRSLEGTNVNRHLCSGNTLVLQSIFDKLTDFIETYHDVPQFTFTFISNPTHDNPNGLGVVDLPLMRTLTDLNTRGLLNNTVLMIFGDHGSRYGPIRNTFQGRLEENLPAFYVSLPHWFRKEHSDLYENLKANKNKLTSNVDVYATLHDVIELGRGHVTPRVAGKYGTSLFRDISTNRTCGDLKIPSHFCVCQSLIENYSTKSQIVKDMSNWLVKKINTNLVNVSHLCSNLTLSTIRHAWRSFYKSSRKVIINSPSKEEFVIQVTVIPSNAVFEANVQYFKQEFILLGDILRLNKYAGQSYCVSRHKDALVLERYCYCRH